ncbi:Autophagy protein 22 [Rhizoclosmatium sp. JEL0117]|nr:Autophagy protein 22 [Rhizoclosmatium sp. JEL0117]
MSKLDETPHILSHEFQDIDQTEVSPKELRAWYLFGGMADPISFAQGFFIPLIVNGLATGGGYMTDDHTKKCDTSITNYSCVVPVGSGWMDTSSFYFYSVVVTTVLQLILFIGMGSVADHGNYRKKFMLGFSTLGAIACILFLAVIQPGNYWFGGILAVLIGVCLGSTWVFNYAFLPPLARNHPNFLVEARKEGHTRDTLLAKLDEVTNYISSTSFVYMYSGTLIILVVFVAVTYIFPTVSGFPTEYYLHVGMAIAGFFWLGGVIIAAKYLRERPGPDFPEGENPVFFSTKQVFHSISEARKLPNLFLFLLGWFCYSDSFGTLVSVSVLWAKTNLGFTSTQILILGAEVPILALIGAYLWNKAQVKWKISSKTLLLIQNGVYIFIPVWGLLSFIPSLPFGFKSKIELFVAAGIHGFLLGATQSSCRSLFAQLLPAGYESKFFSLYEITDKGSSWIGPLVVGAIDNSGSSKSFVFLFLAIQFTVGFLFFINVNVDKGIEEGKEYGALERERADNKRALA